MKRSLWITWSKFLLLHHLFCYLADANHPQAIAILCSSFGRENGQPLLICSSRFAPASSGCVRFFQWLCVQLWNVRNLETNLEEKWSGEAPHEHLGNQLCKYVSMTTILWYSDITRRNVHYLLAVFAHWKTHWISKAISSWRWKGLVYIIYTYHIASMGYMLHIFF